MYESPKLERFGTFREMTQFTLMQSGGDGFGMFCGDNTVGTPGEPGERYS